ncbi:MAG: ABC transporter permease subunit [Bdellovibrionales bacterium]
MMETENTTSQFRSLKKDQLTVANNNSEIRDDAFDPALKEDKAIQQLTRPSLSYWQDAWIRLKKNKKALISLYTILGIVAFSLLGPLVYQVDPNSQNLNMISQPPQLGKTGVVMSADVLGDVVINQNIAEEPDDFVDELGKTNSLSLLGSPTTIGVHIQWEPVEGAFTYAVYRNEHEPTSNQDLGIPLFETEYANQLSYIDSLQLELKEYFYTVVATDGADESELYTTIAVTPTLAYTLEQARAKDPSLTIGSEISSQAYPLGTDSLGRDMLARLMQGGRISFFIGFFAPLLYILFGTLYGGIAGFMGGSLDNWLMRASDFVVALPFLLFMILFYVAFGAGPGESGVAPMLLAMVILLWPATARLVRGQVLQLREEGFTQAAQLMGASNFYILLRHMIPNTIGVILVTLTFAIPSAIFTEAFLSFIGMGVAPPTPSWGVMCNEGIKSMLNSPHELIFPALLISITVLSFNLLGDGLRDALDARMRSRE